MSVDGGIEFSRKSVYIYIYIYMSVACALVLKLIVRVTSVCGA